jgi:hypothetical protein
LPELSHVNEWSFVTSRRDDQFEIAVVRFRVHSVAADGTPFVGDLDFCLHLLRPDGWRLVEATRARGDPLPDCREERLAEQYTDPTLVRMRQRIDRLLQEMPRRPGIRGRRILPRKSETQCYVPCMRGTERDCDFCLCDIYPVDAVGLDPLRCLGPS